MFNYQNIFNALKKHSIALAIKMNIIMKNYDKADTQIKTAIAKWPNDILLLRVALGAYHSAQRWDSFYEIYTQIEKMHPKKLSVKRNFGTALLSSGRYEDAIPHFVYCIENWNLDDSNSRTLANTYARLSICYGYLGRWELLYATLQEAEKIAGWDPDIAYGYLLYYAGTNNSEKIQGYLDHQIKKYPGLHALYYWKALYTQYYLHDIEASLSWYESSLRKLNYFAVRTAFWRAFFSPQQYAAPWYILKRSIEVCVQSNKLNKALWLIYSSKLRILDGDIDIRLLRVYFDIMKKSFEVAEKKCRSMLKKKLSVELAAEYSSLLALAEAKQGKLDEGLSNIKQALALNSELYDAWDTMGFIQMQKKDWQSAIQTYQRMIAINRFDFRCWENLGLCYINIKEMSSAKTSYERAVQLNPFEADAWIDLANTYVKLGNNDLALSAYQNGLKYDWLDAEKRQQTHQAIERMKLD